MQYYIYIKVVKSLSHVQLFATPWTAAHQAPPSMGVSRQEYWSGLPFPSPTREREVAQSCLTLHDPIDCSPPGSSIHGSFQARALEWVAIAFSDLCPYTQLYACTITRYLSRSMSTPRATPLSTVCRCVYLCFCTRIQLP